MPFSDVVTGFTVAVFGFDVDVVLLGFIVTVFAGFDVEAGLFVVAGFDEELALLDDDEAGFDVLLEVGFVVLDEFPLLPVLLFDVVVPLFDAMVLLPFCFGVRAFIFSSSSGVISIGKSNSLAKARCKYISGSILY